MLWKIYVWIFAAVNLLSITAFRFYPTIDSLIALFSLILSVGLNVAAFSYAYKKPVVPKIGLDWLFKLNVGIFGLFFLFELITFFQEAIGMGIPLPTSGLVSIIASFPSLPALYATYLLVYSKPPKPKKAKKKA